MTTLIVFPGQGHAPDRATLARAALHEARSARGGGHLARAARAAGLHDAAEFLAAGGRALDAAAVVSPLVVAVGLTALDTLEDEGRGDVTLLGHSLGELTADAAAGALRAADAIAIAAARGRALDAAAASSPGALVAIDPADLPRARGATGGRVAVALDNAPDELVLGGSLEAIAAVVRTVPARRLRVAGAFHTELMRPARDALARALDAVSFSTPRRPLWSAVTAARLDDGDAVRDALLEGITGPVRFRETLAAALAEGATRVAIAPPVAAVRALVRRCAGRLAVSEVQACARS